MCLQRCRLYSSFFEKSIAAAYISSSAKCAADASAKAAFAEENAISFAASSARSSRQTLSYAPSSTSGEISSVLSSSPVPIITAVSPARSPSQSSGSKRSGDQRQFPPSAFFNAPKKSSLTLHPPLSFTLMQRAAAMRKLSC